MIPGLNPDNLIRLMEEAVVRCELDLNGLTVLTEAASGAYVVTPLLAALAHARQVYAIARDSRFGSAEEIAENTYKLARRMELESRITVIEGLSPEIVKTVDILTNSGHVRPITAEIFSQMKCNAVVSLMYENWEFRSSDLDLDAARAHGIRVGGTNERHPTIGVFEYLGIMAVKLLLEAGVSVCGSRILIICDNDFGPYLGAGLNSAKAHVQQSSRVPEQLESFNAILIAATPRSGAVLSDDEMRRIAQDSPGAVLVQFFGDVDRQALGRLGIAVWPEKAPDKGHMGILPSAIGPEPIVRLQAGGLKAGEVLYHGRFGVSDPTLEFVHPF